jgi:tRNA A-37 threonylcarbamoyl transferase component Bud32
MPPRTIDDIGNVVVDHGLAHDVRSVVPLSGGVSGTVFRLETDAGCMVVKQPLERLAVRAPWRASRTRVLSEASALDIAGQILGERVPRVLYLDRDEFVIVLACIEGCTWKEDLMGGSADVGVAGEVATCLAQLHRETMGLVHDVLMDRSHFMSLRIEPFFRVVSRSHPEFAPLMQAVDDLLLVPGICMVHGDYSPKNILITPRDGTGIALLDFEVAHIGNPVFDLAYVLAHLILKQIAGRAFTAESAAVVINSYREAEGPCDLGESLTLVVAALLVARVLGWSPVEYLDADAQAAALATARRMAQDPRPMLELLEMMPWP